MGAIIRLHPVVVQVQDVLLNCFSMNVLDQLALNQASVAIGEVAGVEILSSWQQLAENRSFLQLRLELLKVKPTPFIAQYTDWVVSVDFHADIWGKVQVYPMKSENGISATFPHQMFNGRDHETLTLCRAGHICTSSAFDPLAANRNAIPQEPGTTIERIVWHINRALEWLESAATDRLSMPGAIFELPDFNFGKFATSAILAYSENDRSLEHWQKSSKSSGIVELAVINSSRIFLAKRFLDEKKREVIYEPEFGGYLSAINAVIPAMWIMLPGLPVVNQWQAPSTVGELQQACEGFGIDLNALLEPLWSKLNEQQASILLAGSPIPRKIGNAASYVHWQALVMGDMPRGRNSRALQSAVKHHMKMEKHELSWLAKSENWDANEIQRRGRLAQELCDTKILLLGAGALGSDIAETLVRMGVQNMCIVDNERLEAGNLVRHTLTMENLSEMKSLAIARRLNVCNPSAKISFIEARLPDPASDELADAIKDADIIIDVTANDEVLKCMPLTNVKEDALFVSCSLGLEAKKFFFYSRAAKEVTWQDFEEWFAPYRSEQDELAQKMELPRGMGCWHPLTPARLNRIHYMSGIAVEYIEQVFQDRASLPAKTVVDYVFPALSPNINEEKKV